MKANRKHQGICFVCASIAQTIQYCKRIQRQTFINKCLLGGRWRKMKRRAALAFIRSMQPSPRKTRNFARRAWQMAVYVVAPEVLTAICRLYNVNKIAGRRREGERFFSLIAHHCRGCSVDNQRSRTNYFQYSWRNLPQAIFTLR